jgi:hypothetical protein
MWRVITLAAVLWPSHIAGILDGAPLDTLPECVLAGLLVPALIWFHPAFLKTWLARAAIAAILLLKVGGALVVQQEGWCITFVPPTPMVRESTGKPHAWDIRADWLADDPSCSAVMTRSYRDSFEVPAWFFNLPPPNDAVVRDGFHPGEIPIRLGGFGFITVNDAGTFALSTTAPMNVEMRVDGTRVDPAAPGRHERALTPGTHSIQFEGTMLGKQWRVVPEWNGVTMGSMRFPLTTIAPPSRVDRVVTGIVRWLLFALVSGLIAAWLIAGARHVGEPSLLLWTAGAAVAIAVVAIYWPQQAPWYTAAAIAVPLLMPPRRRFMTSRGVFLLVLVPWLAFVAASHAAQVGRWTLYGIGNDNFLFQRFSYRIFMQHFWLEGGQLTFWNQPLFRWIAGVLHMLFGDSSVGQVYWDAAGVAFMAMFAYRMAAPIGGFSAGLLAAILPLVMFLLGPALEFVGFGLSEISSASLIYLAAFFAIRNRGVGDVIAAGVLVTLGFYTRLNNLPMAMAVAAFALPLTLPIGAMWRPRRWLPLVQWRVVFGIAAALVVGAMLFAWRTWYYTGVFGVFHGTQREFLAVWKPGMTFAQAVPAMGSSLMMVLTAADPPALSWHAVPLLAAAIICVAGVLNLPGFRNAPLPVVAFYVAQCSGALVTRGWGHEGRFSIHLYGAASALCLWALARLAINARYAAPIRVIFPTFTKKETAL